VEEDEGPARPQLLYQLESNDHKMARSGKGGESGKLIRRDTGNGML